MRSTHPRQIEFSQAASAWIEKRNQEEDSSRSVLMPIFWGILITVLFLGGIGGIIGK